MRNHLSTIALPFAALLMLAGCSGGTASSSDENQSEGALTQDDLDARSELKAKLADLAGDYDGDPRGGGDGSSMGNIKSMKISAKSNGKYEVHAEIREDRDSDWISVSGTMTIGSIYKDSSAGTGFYSLGYIAKIDFADAPSDLHDVYASGVRMNLNHTFTDYLPNNVVRSYSFGLEFKDNKLTQDRYGMDSRTLRGTLHRSDAFRDQTVPSDPNTDPCCEGGGG